MTRLLHFTDMHLRHHQPGSAGPPERLSREMPAALERLAARIAELAPDAVVMTGDVLDVPDPVIAGESPDGRPVETWVDEARADFRLVRDWFDGLGVDYLVVPGNHDHEPAFTDVFGDTSGPRDVAGFRFFSFWDQLSAARQPVRTGARAELFEAALTAPEHDRPQVHLQHYMIDPPTVSRGFNYEYEDAARMKRAIEESGRVRAVLSGHLHPGSLVTGETGVIHSLPPAFCEAPHPFRVYDLADGGGAEITDHALDA
ncbi:MAG: metallophosphoesterase [Magnetovibrio sp.]|nr:metallophosphoesterase [Magnetovibrio sp.]